MSNTQFNQNDDIESFVRSFEAASPKARLSAMTLILADHAAVNPGPLPPRPGDMSPELESRFRRAIQEAQEWELATIKN